MPYLGRRAAELVQRRHRVGQPRVVPQLTQQHLHQARRSHEPLSTLPEHELSKVSASTCEVNACSAGLVACITWSVAVASASAVWALRMSAPQKCRWADASLKLWLRFHTTRASIDQAPAGGNCRATTRGQCDVSQGLTVLKLMCYSLDWVVCHASSAHGNGVCRRDIWSHSSTPQ